ncbi:VOC family protein [Paenibacillus turpanensis]|uniref:VOC family protein n=1 Tax=Paenibacillus turpanensis TaxID=2689078 RepID=UPI0014080A2E|nr:VOC family protein [Paenibacillus turpanensis]
MFRVVHFELQTDKPEELAQFYSKVFGWKVRQVEGDIPYWHLQTGTGEQHTKGINGGAALIRAEERQGRAAAVNTVEVPSVIEMITSIEANGGRQASPVMELPGGEKFVYCEDPHGIVFGLIERQA